MARIGPHVHLPFNIYYGCAISTPPPPSVCSLPRRRRPRVKQPPGIYGKVLKSTSVYAAGILLNRAVSLFLLPLYTRYLTAADYGILELVDVTMSVSSLVIGARLATGVAYFCSTVQSEAEKSTVYTTNLFGCMMAAVIACLAGFFGAPHLGRLILGTPDATEVFLIAVGGLALNIPAESLLGRLRVEDRPVFFGVLNLIRLVLNVTLNVVLLVVLGLGFKAILWSSLTCNLLISLFAVVSTIRSHGTRFSGSLFLAMLRFTIPMGVVGISLLVFHVADRFFLRRYSTLTEIGLYSLGYKLGMMISYVQMAFNQHWSAKSYDLLKGKDRGEVFAHTFTYFFAAMMAAAVATWVFAAPILRILTTPSFYASISFVPWIVFAYLVRAVADYVRVTLYVSHRPSLDAWASLFSAVFCLAAYALLIPGYGALGACWATALTSCVMLASSVLFSRRLFPLRIESRRVAILSLGGAALALTSTLLSPAGLASQIALGAASCLCFLGGVLWIATLTASERAMVGSTLRSLLPLRGASGLSA